MAFGPGGAKVGNWLASLAAIAAMLMFSLSLPAQPTRPASTGAVSVWVTRTDPPRTIDDLRALEKLVEDVAARVSPATVMVYGGGGQGSGVIVSKDGYILTAGHATVQPGAAATIVLPDGRQVRAKALGIDRSVDAGLLQITDAGPWPCVDIGQSATLKVGQFVMALGQPTWGYTGKRPPVVRIGKLIRGGDVMLQTDCVLEGGDSGGPLFDLQGRVVGINGYIGDAAALNVHAPVDAFAAGWQHFLKEEIFGVRAVGDKMLGLEIQDNLGGCLITGVADPSPAQKAGFKAGDLLVKFGSADIKTQRAMVELLVVHQAGDQINLTVIRDGNPLKISVKLAASTTWPAHPVNHDLTRDGDSLKNLFRGVVATAAKSVVRLRSDNKDIGLGTIISADGFIITAEDCLHEPLSCLIQSKPLPAKVVGRDAEHGLALLKVDAANLAPIIWSDATALQAGQFVAVPSPSGSVVNFGVVSVVRQSVPADSFGHLGHTMFLDAAGLPIYSARASGFPAVLQHDALLRPADCGGPLVDLSGKAIALNISRSSRTAAYSIPADVLLPILDKLKQ